MPAPSNRTGKRIHTDGDYDLIRHLVEQVNNLVDTVRTLTAKLDADAGVGDANYAATLTDAAVATAPRKIDLI